MKSVVSLCLIASAAIVVVTASVPEQQPAPFRSGSKTVAVYGTVTDREGRMVPNLTREDFEIRDNGKPQPITVFSNDVQPITVVMMLDRSGSMRGNFGLVEAAAEAFVAPARARRQGAHRQLRRARSRSSPADFTSDQRRADPHPAVGPAAGHRADAALERRGRGDHRAARAGRAPRRARLQRRRRRADELQVQQPQHHGRHAPRAAGERHGLRDRPADHRAARPPGGRRRRRAERGRDDVAVGPIPGLRSIAEDTGGGYFEINRAENLASTFARRRRRTAPPVRARASSRRSSTTRCTRWKSRSASRA